MLVSISLSILLLARLSVSSGNIFYLGPNYPKPQFHNTNENFIEIKITKSSEWIDGEIGGEVYEGDTVEVTCYGSSNDRTQHHFLVLKNDTGEKNFNFTKSQVIDRSISSYRVVANYLDSGEYKCVFHSKSRIIEKTQQLNVIKVQMPKPRELHNENLNLKYGKEANIECEMIEGYPKSSYEWTKNRKTVGNSRILTIETVDSDDGGEYLCTATNRAGKGYSVFNITVNGVPEGSTTVRRTRKVIEGPLIIVLITLAVLSMIISLVLINFLIFPALFCCCRNFNKSVELGNRNRNRSSLTRDFRGIELAAINGEAPLINSRPHLLIKSSDLIVTEMLGEGNFGYVMAGKLKTIATSSVENIAVAVKTPKEKGNEDQLKMIQDEYDVMLRIRPHPNILTLIGGVRGSDGSSITELMLEMCEFKSLADYFKNMKTIGTSIETLKEDQLSFSYQVANGMEYLARVPCVHRDLAARNVLLTYNKVCRVADFGLMRIHENKSYYMARYATPMPVRWMAAETITKRRYTQKSDVWTFAILLFEIFSLGERPFPNVDSYFVEQHILEGKVNGKPEHCPNNIYKLMKECWNLKPDKRPCFSKCLKFFEKFLKSQKPETYRGIRSLLKQEAHRQLLMQTWFIETGNAESNENEVAGPSDALISSD